MREEKTTSQIIKNRARRDEGKLSVKIFRWSLWAAFFAIVYGFIGTVGTYFILSKNLPKISTLAEYRPPIITVVYSDDNRKVAEFYNERRIVVPLEKIPTMLQEAFIAAEDSRFYQHSGIDFYSIIRAFFKNLEAGSIVQGGSTITQQVTKSFLLSPEKSYTRKIREAILAHRIDKSFTKDEVLFLYLNQIYLGHGAYGVQAASENYFGKPVEELNLAESAIMAGLPQAPSRYSPFRFPDRAEQRQIYVLNRMVEEGYITNIQATEAIDTELDIKPRKNWYIEEVPFYTEHIRRYVEKKYGAKALYQDGMSIYASVNIEMQKTAQEEVNKGLHDLDKRQGYRGSLNNVVPKEIEAYSKKLQKEYGETSFEAGAVVKGVVIEVNTKNNSVFVRMGSNFGMIKIDNMKWARKPNPEIAHTSAVVKRVGDVLSVGDVILVKIINKIKDTHLWDLALEQDPIVEAALMCIEADTGHVKAMVGGRDFRKTQFNRAVQSRRQPGSSFKPIIYSAAIDKGYTPATIILDAPIVFKDKKRDFTWKPKNYAEKFHGPTLLRDALAKSRNIVTIKILKDIGIDYAIDYAKKMGVSSHLNRDLSIALGSSGVSLLELARAYSVFNNRGYLIEPTFILKIVDRDGNVLEENTLKKEKVLEESTAYVMTSLLEGVVKRGTGARVRALNRPTAGKTGTTNDLYDAWFMGYTPRYTTGVWVGFDEEASLGRFETGSKAASPIWLGYMQRVLKEKPVRTFPVPEGVVFSKIDAETGLLPIPESKETIFECFKEGTVPTRYTKKPGTVQDEDDFFKSGI
ncbi:MAG: PBP1A family penicillin-binding protein [Deltaproteobacteria bacterium]|nr:PBP1A family penicillin-binding protein [Deltaproteobacteria bacterium]